MIEIERKFLVVADAWPKGVRQIEITQGYLVRNDGMVLRVRQKGERHFLSVKARIDDRSSYDFEYSIPADDARIMFNHMCVESLVRKTRHEVVQDELMWEIDEFHDENTGLVVAEIELSAVDETFTLPSWLSTEVTSDKRYRNASLAARPFSTWRQETASS